MLNLTDAEKTIAESAKKSLLRANDVFSKMAPLYKSPAAKKFKFVDENMFSAGPDLPGYFYADELFNIVARKGITPKTVADIEELVGPAAFASSVRTWMDKGFKNALQKQPVDFYETIILNIVAKITYVLLHFHLHLMMILTAIYLCLLKEVNHITGQHLFLTTR